MGAIKHVFSNAIADGADPTIVRPSDWNSAHNYTLQDAVSLSGNNTAGVLAGISSGTLYLAGGNNITLSQNANSVTISGPNAGGAQTGISSIVAGASTQTVGMISFSNANGISFGMSSGANTGTITASYTVPSTAGLLSNVNVSAGTTSNNLSAVTFSNSNNVSFGLNGSTVTASATVASTQGSINLSAGTTSNLASAFTFSNSNGVSFGLNASTITGSVAAQTTQSAIKGFGASNTGNTAGNTGISTGVDWVIAGTNNITVSESTVGGGPNTLWLSAPNVAAGNVSFSAGTSSAAIASLVFSNSNGVSFGLNGSTITGSVAGGGGTVNQWIPGNGSLNPQNANKTLFISYSSAGQFVTAGSGLCWLSISQSTSSNSSYSIGLSIAIGVYTRNVSTLSLASSGSQTYAWSITSNNTTTNQAGMRMATVPITLSVTPGDYWIAYSSSTATTNANWATLSYVCQTMNGVMNFSGYLGQANNNSIQPVLGVGVYTSTTAALPASIPFSSISGLGGNFLFAIPWVGFGNITA